MGVGLWGTTSDRVLRVLAASGRADFIRLFQNEDVVSVGIFDVKGKRLYLLNANGEQSAFVSSGHYGSPRQIARTSLRRAVLDWLIEYCFFPLAGGGYVQPVLKDDPRETSA